MSFERDVFISYAHIDNQPLLSGKEGWVSVFHKALQQVLSQVIGAPAQIWRDEKLKGNDVFADEIVDQFPKTAALISVLTPRYVNSEWCRREINEFCGVAEQSGGVVVFDNKSRVFKVIKTPVDKQDPLPAIVNKMLGYEFYEFDEEQTPLELDPVFGDDKSKHEFLVKVQRLAWDIKRLLDQLRSGQQAPPGAGEAASKPVVYLAECSRDRRKEREIIEGELKRQGYAILPDQQLPSDEDEYTAAVERLLARCQLSVHLIGSGYGLIPEGASQKSIVVLQNELAVKRAKASALRRVIWIPAGTSGEQAAQQAFIEGLHNNADLQYGADLLTSDIEGLKGAIQAALTKLETPATAKPAQQAAGADRRKLVYVLCDEKDQENSIPLLEFLVGRGLDVTLPVFAGEAAQVREANRELFMNCDAVLLFYGAGDAAWKFHQQNELKKLRAERPDGSLLAQYTYLAEPITVDKKMVFTVEKRSLIDALKGFSETSMVPFLEAVDPSGANI